MSTLPMISACWRLMHYDEKISGALIRTHDLWIRKRPTTPQRLTSSCWHGRKSINQSYYFRVYHAIYVYTQNTDGTTEVNRIEKHYYWAYLGTHSRESTSSKEISSATLCFRSTRFSAFWLPTEACHLPCSIMDQWRGQLVERAPVMGVDWEERQHR